MAKPRICKDCPPMKKPRPAPYPGPRCATDWRIKRSLDKLRAHTNHVARVYSLAEGEYAALLAFQGGKCYVCRRANGATKKLAVDHDHATGEVRGLLCSNCNRWVVTLGREGLLRALLYLRESPYAQWRLGQ